MSAWHQQEVCSTFILVLAHFLWQSSLIALALMIALRAVKAVSVRYWLSLAALFLMSACPIATLVCLAGPDISMAMGDLAPVVREEGESVSLADRQELSTNGIVHPNDSPPLAAKEWPISTAPVDQIGWRRLAPSLAGLYLAGASFMLFRLAIGVCGGGRLRQRVTPVLDAPLLMAFQRQAKALGMTFHPLLAYCDRVTVPTVIGVLKPMILLPITFTSGLSSEQISSVLAHELAHLRRYDHLVNLLQRIIESLLFFCPAVWWVSNRVREEREHCCDDLVVACGAKPLDYANMLLRVAELSRGAALPSPIAALSIEATGSQPSTLRQRIARLLGESAAPSLKLSPRMLATSALATMVALAALIRMGISDEPPTSPPTGNEAAEVSSEAEAILRLIPEGDTLRRVEALVTLSRAKHRRGDREATLNLLAKAESIALEVAFDGKDRDGFPNAWGQSAALMQVCVATARLEGIAAAQHRAAKIAAPHYHVLVLCDIADLQAQASDLDAARQTLSLALASARQVPDISEELAPGYANRQSHRVTAFEQVVAGHAKIGDTMAALTIVEELAASARTENCWNAFQELLKLQIVAGNEARIDEVLDTLDALDKASRIKGDEPVLDKLRILRSARIAAAEELVAKEQLSRAEDLVDELKSAESLDGDSWELDSLVAHIALRRIENLPVNAPADFAPPTEDDFSHRHSFLTFTALYGRELAKRGERARASELFATVVDESRKLAANDRPAAALIFVAQGYAILGNATLARTTADSIDPTPEVYVRPADMDFYGLPFQPMTCRATALALIAQAHLDRGNVDDALATLETIPIETTPDGKAKSWYLERVKANTLAGAADWLCRHDKRDRALKLVEYSETSEIRTTVLSQMEAGTIGSK